MTKSNDFDVCQRYVENSLQHLQEQLEECQLKLMRQSQLYSIQDLTLEQLDQSLKEIVDQHRHYLANRQHNKLHQFKDDLNIETLFQRLRTFNLCQQQVLCFSLPILKSIYQLFFSSLT